MYSTLSLKKEESMLDIKKEKINVYVIQQKHKINNFLHLLVNKNANFTIKIEKTTHNFASKCIHLRF